MKAHPHCDRIDTIKQVIRYTKIRNCQRVEQCQRRLAKAYGLVVSNPSPIKEVV